MIKYDTLYDIARLSFDSISNLEKSELFNVKFDKIIIQSVYFF